MSVPNFARLSDRVHLVLGLNPGPFTLQGTNTYLVGQGPKRILLDTGDGNPAYQNHLKECISKAGAVEISGIICTHRHSDHVGGISQVQDLMNKEIPVYKRHSSTDGQESGYLDIQDGQIFSTSGATLRAYSTPGHTEDHISFYLEEESSIFTGDCILGSGSSAFENLSGLIKSLQTLQSISNVKRLYPGHGPVVEDGMKMINNYIAHRQERELQIIGILHEGARKNMDIVKVLYQGYPAEVLEKASQMVAHHLDKLVQEGKVAIDNDCYRLL